MEQTEYKGKPGHERKTHQTHFMVNKKVDLKGKSNSVWVEVRPGRFKLVHKHGVHTKQPNTR